MNNSCILRRRLNQFLYSIEFWVLSYQYTSIQIELVNKFFHVWYTGCFIIVVQCPVISVPITITIKILINIFCKKRMSRKEINQFNIYKIWDISCYDGFCDVINWMLMIQLCLFQTNSLLKSWSVFH